MSTSNNAEPLSLPDRQKPKRHNAKLCSVANQQRIINALANGDSIRSISRTLHVSNNTVVAIREEEWQQVEARKQRIAAQCERNATLAADQLTERLETEKLSANQLVPILGVSVDKLLALRGEPQMTIGHEHLHVQLTDEDMWQAMLLREALRERGALPNVETDHAILPAILARKAMTLRLQASTDTSASGENAQQKGQSQSLIEGITPIAERSVAIS